MCPPPDKTATKTAAKPAAPGPKGRRTRRSRSGAAKRPRSGVVTLLVGFVLALALGGTLAVFALRALYQSEILECDCPHLAREEIRRAIGTESPITYRDGQTRLGVLFDAEHRQWTPLAEIPPAWVDAIIAAEDEQFYEHEGVNWRGVARAVWVNLRSMSLVAGGSSITQQTAKNLYYRQGRSLGEKWTELVNTLRLEARYSKDEILEFYANQFHVNANGRGYAIAARYFFNATPKELGPRDGNPKDDLADLVANAFIAGSVKGPFLYNPFVGDTARRDSAQARAKARVGYVLGRMRSLGRIDEATYTKALATPIPFRRGRFQFDDNVAVEAVRELMQTEAMETLLQEKGIENPATAGLHITTTLEAPIQKRLYAGALARLEQVGAQLAAGTRGHDPVAIFFDTAATPTALHPGEAALYDVVTGVVEPWDKGDLSRAFKTYREAGLAGPSAQFMGLTPKNPKKLAAIDVVKVRVGDLEGVVDVTALDWMATVLMQAESGKDRVTPGFADTQALRQAFKPGTPLRCVVTAMAPGTAATGGEVLALWPVPAPGQTGLEGGVLILEEGRVRGLMGGAENRGFNRALSARRPFGSTFKPALLAASLELGWKPTDALDNRRAAFAYMRQVYMPRPDHTKRPPTVSLGWTGVLSENVASIWLVHHLTEKLTPDAFAKLAAEVGLSPQTAPGGAEGFGKLLRDKLGILLLEGDVLHGAYLKARQDTVEALAFDDPDTAMALTRLPWGGASTGFDDALADEKTPGVEGAIRRALLLRQFMRLIAPATRLTDAADRLLPGKMPDDALLRDLWATGEAVTASEGGEDGSVRPSGPSERDGPLLVYAPVGADGGSLVRLYLKADSATRTALEKEDLADPRWAGLKPVTPARFAELIGLDGTDNAADLLRLARVDGLTPAVAVTGLESRVKALAEPLLAMDRLEPAVLHTIPDFRMTVGLYALRRFMQRAGVARELPAVPSLPLGVADATLFDMATLYQTMFTGFRPTFGSGLFGPGPMSLVTRRTSAAALPSYGLVERITDGDGNVLFELAAERERILPDAVAQMMTRILSFTPVHGTAKRLRRVDLAVPLHAQDPALDKALAGLRLRPVLAGKTGTTNDYTTSAFVGFVPNGPAPHTGPGEGLGGPFTVAAYVGYDDNRKMVRGARRIAGAAGGLMLWVEAAKAIAGARYLADAPADGQGGSGGLDANDLTFATADTMLPQPVPTGLVEVPVSAETGLPLSASEAASATPQSTPTLWVVP
jgi:penicillin-binding protein 1A